MYITVRLLKSRVKCPIWVKSVVLTARQPLPIYLHKRTISAFIGTSQRDQNAISPEQRTSAAKDEGATRG